MIKYEAVRTLVEQLESNSDAKVRDVHWLTDAEVIGVARDPVGRVEVLLAGPELRTSSSIIKDALEFRVVHRAGQSSFGANRLMLPAVAHFDQVAAFICTELLRAGADDSLQQAFRDTEPIVELAIERARLSSRVIVGLAGELRFLDALCRRADNSQLAEVISGWKGWRRSARDLTIGMTGVEVKTTLRASSSHLVEGIHQVELQDGSEGASPESRLLLVSIGLQVSPDGGNAFSIPQLVDRTIARMSVAGLADSVIDAFLTHLAEYGSDHGGGYDHRAHMYDRAYDTRFLTSFFRAYDMTGDALKVLRWRDLVAYVHVDPRSVKFRVDLPTTVTPQNPIVGANRVAGALLG